MGVSRNEPLELKSYFIEIRKLYSTINVSFRNEVRSTNSVEDALAKQGVEGEIPWLGVIIYVRIGWGTILAYLFVFCLSFYFVISLFLNESLS